MHAAGVSFPDLLMSRGEYQMKLEPPFVAGGEVAGVVRSAPEGSSTLVVKNTLPFSIATRLSLSGSSVRSASATLLSGPSTSFFSFFAVATTKGVIGVVAVLTSLYPVITVALARAFLGERLSSGQALGVVAAVAGVAAISLG